MQSRKILRERKAYYERLLRKLSAREGFLLAGIPRFKELFGRDSLISALETLNVSPNILGNTLRILAKNQGRAIDSVTGEEPGKILHELYSRKWGTKNDEISRKQKFPKPDVAYFYSIDSTPLFVIGAEEYYKATHDRDLIGEILHNIVSAVDWIVRYGLKDGLLVYNRDMYGRQLASMCWKDGCWGVYDGLDGDIAAVEVQSYTYRALEGFMEIAKRFDTGYNTGILKGLLKKLHESTDGRMWMEEIGAYSPALSLKDGKRITSLTSSQGHLLYSGIINNTMADKVVKSLFGDSMLTKYGIRTTAAGDPYFDEKEYQKGSVWFNDNWFIAKGLQTRGYADEYSELRKRILDYVIEKKYPLEYIGMSRKGRMMDEKGLTVKPCRVQAWTVGAFLDLINEELTL